MRKYISLFVFAMLFYVVFELLYFIFTSSYTVIFQLIRNGITILIEWLGTLNTPNSFDWRWFILLFINILVALMITFFYTRRFNAKKYERLEEEVALSKELLNFDIDTILNIGEVKKTGKQEPIVLDYFNEEKTDYTNVDSVLPFELDLTKDNKKK